MDGEAHDRTVNLSHAWMEAGGYAGGRCSRCGYDTSGLPRDSVCPECAEPIVPAPDAVLMEHAPRGYVTRLRAGAWLAAWGAGGLLCLGAAAVEVYEVSAPWATVLSPVGAALLLGSGVPFSIGWIMLTSADPRAWISRRFRHSSACTRVLAASSLALCGVAFILVFWDRDGMLPVCVLSVLFTLAVPIPGCLPVSGLATRLESRRLEERTAFALGIAFGAGLLIAMLALMVFGGGGSGNDEWVILFVLIAMCVAVYSSQALLLTRLAWALAAVTVRE